MDSAGIELHPNWRALTTLHVPLKRFVPEGATNTRTRKIDLVREKSKIDGVSGAEIKEFYEQLVRTNYSDIEEQATMIADKQMVHAVRRSKQLQPFNKNEYFRCAMTNNVTALQNMHIHGDDINVKDAFGWTALMIAACEGAERAVRWLYKLGADLKIKDKSGNTACDLARKKGHLSIVRLLENCKSDSMESGNLISNESVEPFYCTTCQCMFSETTLKAHQTSTVHKFNEKSTMPVNKLNKFNISIKNRGLQLMVKQGWDREHGLGPGQNGRLYPVKTTMRKWRTGLGIDQPVARITHFAAYDIRATQQRQPPTQCKTSQSDIKHEKLYNWKRDRLLRSELS